jgi:hypothetical protein
LSIRAYAKLKKKLMIYPIPDDARAFGVWQGGFVKEFPGGERFLRAGIF